MDIVVLKSLTSEEIIAELVSQEDETITVQTPVYLVINPESRQAVFQPFIPASSIHDKDNPKPIKFFRDKLLTPLLEPSPQTAEMYQQVFSNLVLPPNAIIQ